MPVCLAWITGHAGFEWFDLPVAFVAYVVIYLAFAWVFPPLIRSIWWQIIHVTFRFRAYGQANIPATGPVLIVCNHVSYLDWMLLWLASPRPLKIMLWGGYYKNPLARFWLSFARHRTIRLETRNGAPHAAADALEKAAEELKAGHAVLIFPEGRLTRNGQMRPFGRGVERILKLAGPVPVVPACTDGMWGSLLSHKGGRMLWKWPEGLRRKVNVWFGKPLAGSPTAPEMRAAVQEAIADVAIATSDDVFPVHRWFVYSATRWRNLFRTLVVDYATGSERALSSAKTFVGAWALAGWLKPRLGDSPNVGIWLPTGLGSLLANLACAFLRRPTVNLNYTAGPEAMASAIRQAGLTHVITSKRFEAKVPFDAPPGITKLALEEALPAISGLSKFLKLLMVISLPHGLLSRILGLYRTKPDDLLTIVFSSGSTGEPKGVMLTHRNIGSNGLSFHVGVDLNDRDTMMGTLPFFHSFGYTVCLWAPVCIGMKVVYYPDPRAAKEVGELVAKHKCTIVLGTATFVRFYLRRCQPDDFQSTRLIICGAEKLPVKLAQEFQAKFGVLPLEGYGCTELSPVVCTNLHDLTVKGVTQVANALGTVGQPIPGVVAKAFDLETDRPLPPGDEGMLCVKGANVMLGYLGKPEQTAKVIRNGWYTTGDLGLIEPDGFIRITGRLSRFAKIAGEMVPLEKLEEEMQELFGTGDRLVAVAAVPDERRGERLVVLYLPEAEAKLTDVLAGLPGRGLPNLWVPDRRDCYAVDQFPALGSGKLDLKGITELAKRLAGKA
jgi:acyl-[acyl-carrier-protein]-phospholipid O-acyltransferase/long-chain-fatty-acid--[acyl-carrier-protein] ligase